MLSTLPFLLFLQLAGEYKQLGLSAALLLIAERRFGPRIHEIDVPMLGGCCGARTAVLVLSAAADTAAATTVSTGSCIASTRRR